MDIGKTVSCQRCTTQFNMYHDTHPRKGNNVGGMCPNCNAWVTAKVSLDNGGFIYPEHPAGVKITPLPYYSGD